jgi:hypothetical protein
VLRELISWPISMTRAAIELPRAMERSMRDANDLMEVTREQLEVMRRQADQALEQAEKMNELLTRVVKLTEPLERAQRSGEYVGDRLKRAIFGPEEVAQGAQGAADQALDTADDAEIAAETAEEPALGENEVER